MARGKSAKRQHSKPRQKVRMSEGSRLIPIVRSNLLSMICVMAAFSTVLAVLLGVAKLT